jgi:hypothetical protein
MVFEGLAIFLTFGRTPPVGSHQCMTFEHLALALAMAARRKSGSESTMAMVTDRRGRRQARPARLGLGERDGASV